ncbi:MAG: DUF4112 domain-containing protein [Blastocatellia bacterium]
MSKPNSVIELYYESSQTASRAENVEMEGLDRIARILDDLIRIPILNLRIGLDPILGLVPWLGDTATALFSLYLIGAAIHYRLPKVVILRMAMNVAFDYLIGIIPFVGDATDFFIKSNRWNMDLLRRYAQERGKPSFTDYLFVVVVIGALVALIAGGIMLIFYSIKSVSSLW